MLGERNISGIYCFIPNDKSSKEDRIDVGGQQQHAAKNILLAVIDDQYFC